MPAKKTKPKSKQTGRATPAVSGPSGSHDPPVWGVAVLLAVVIGLVYGRALHAPFIADDRVAITDNGSITSLWPLLGSGEHAGPLNPPVDLPTSGRPLVNFSFAINYWLGGLQPEGYHVVNIALHYLCSLLLWAIVRRTLRLPRLADRFGSSAGWLALAVALIWALHPLQTETVTYLTQRTELMVGFCYFATFYCSLRYWAAERSGIASRAWLGLAVLVCSAGMLSKEVMVSAPLMVLLFERAFVAATLKGALQRSWPLYAGLSVTYLLLFAMMLGAPHGLSAGFGAGVPAYHWWLTQAKVLVIYLKLVVWPFPLVTHYQFPYFRTLGEAWPYVIAVALLGVLTLAALWRNSSIGYLGTWVFAILAPTSVIPIVTEMAAERRMYLPLAAIVALFVCGGYLLANAACGRWRRGGFRFFGFDTAQLLQVSLTVAIALVCGLVSARRLAAYDDEMQLMRDLLMHQPQDFMTRNSIGGQLIKMGRFQEAIDELRATLALKPDYAGALNNMGIALISSDRFPEAVEPLEYAVKLKPDYAEAQNNLGWALMNVGRLPDSILHLEECLRLQPGNAEAHDNLGVVLVKIRQIPSAIEHFRRAAELNPQLANAQIHLGSILHITGDDQEARKHLELALQMQPARADVHVDLADLLASAGPTKESIEHYQAALRIDGNFAQAYGSLAKALVVANRSDEAIATAEQGIKIARSTGQDAIAGQLEDWLAHYRVELRRNENAVPAKAD